MVYAAPPHLAGPSTTTYADAYSGILAAHRRSPLTAAASVILLVAADVDALCAARMLSSLLRQDDIMYKIWPISGLAHLANVKDELRTYTDLHTLVLLNMGSIFDLRAPEWFGGFSDDVTIHVIDPYRPQSLDNLFSRAVGADRVVVWDDGDAEKLVQERNAFESLEFDPFVESDSEQESDLDDNDSGFSEEEGAEQPDNDENDEEGSPSRKRRRNGSEPRARKRRRREEREAARVVAETHDAVIQKYFAGGSWFGQSSASTVYILATTLERVDNDLLWHAIVGLTYQYITSKIPRSEYDKYHSIYLDEVARLSPDANINPSEKALNPDDSTIRPSEELRFTLFRHWTLYDAMMHSSYVANKMGIWKDRGKKRLTGLLAKMGFSITQTQQTYAHMNLELRKHLRTKLDAIAPEYGMVELTYPSFVRLSGFRFQPLSAADAVESLSVLLEVAGGTRMDVEREGARNGGEWFGGTRVWSTDMVDSGAGGVVDDGLEKTAEREEGGEKTHEALTWWNQNFWKAFDATNDIGQLHDALKLSMSLHKAIIRQGTSVIDKRDIRTMRGHRVAVLSQGPDLQLFSHPGMLSRLALWLVDALRDRIPATNINPRSKKKVLPFVVACLNTANDTYTVVGVTGAPEYDDFRKNDFKTAFFFAKERCNAEIAYHGFGTTVVQIEKDALNNFLQVLCEI